jgi:hypothetical protein
LWWLELLLLLLLQLLLFKLLPLWPLLLLVLAALFMLMNVFMAVSVELDVRMGDELDMPLADSVFSADSDLNERKFTVSLRESSFSCGNRPSDTASRMQGSSPFSNAFDSVLPSLF